MVIAATKVKRNGLRLARSAESVGGHGKAGLCNFPGLFIPPNINPALFHLFSSFFLYLCRLLFLHLFLDLLYTPRFLYLCPAHHGRPSVDCSIAPRNPRCVSPHSAH